MIPGAVPSAARTLPAGEGDDAVWAAQTRSSIAHADARLGRRFDQGDDIDRLLNGEQGTASELAVLPNGPASQDDIDRLPVGSRTDRQVKLRKDRAVVGDLGPPAAGHFERKERHGAAIRQRAKGALRGSAEERVHRLSIFR